MRSEHALPRPPVPASVRPRRRSLQLPPSHEAGQDASWSSGPPCGGWRLRGGDAFPPQRERAALCLLGLTALCATEAGDSAGWAVRRLAPTWIHMPVREGGLPPAPHPAPAGGVTRSLPQGDGALTEGAGVACWEPFVIGGQGVLRQSPAQGALRGQSSAWLLHTFQDADERAQVCGKLGLLAPTCAPSRTRPPPDSGARPLLLPAGSW